MSSSPSRRTLIAREICDTETSYLKQLNIICDVAIPFLQPQLSKEQFSSIFHSIESLRTINSQFCAELSTVLSSWNDTSSQLGNIFIKYIPFMKPYKQYGANYDYARLTLTKLSSDKKFLKISSELFSNPIFCGVSDLTYYLIQPIQRIPRYILLLETLIKDTPSGHRDLKDLKKALQLTESLAVETNDEIKSSQQRETLREITQSLGINVSMMYQPYRYHICTDVLFKHVPRSSDKKRTTILPSNGTPSITKQSTSTPSSPSKSPSSPSSPSLSKSQLKQQEKDEKEQIKNFQKNEKEKMMKREKKLMKRAALVSDPVVSYTFFLFNDILVYASDLGKGKYHTHQVIPITADLELIDYDVESPSFYLIRDYFSFCLKISTTEPSLKQKWLKNLNDAIISARKRIGETNNNAIFMDHPIDIPPNESSTCSNCSVSFGISTHRHSCKFCCQLICDNCGPNYIKMPNGKQMRICKQCDIIRNSHDDGKGDFNAKDGKEKKDKKEQNVAETPKIKKKNTLSTQGSNLHRTKLTEYAKTLGIPAKNFVVPNRYYITTFNCQRLAQNGKIFPTTIMLFNDIIALGTQSSPTSSFTLHQIIPIDQLLGVSTNISKENSKNTNKTFLHMISQEEKNYKSTEKSIYHTHQSFYLKRDDLIIKLYFEANAKVPGTGMMGREYYGGVITALVSQTKTRIPTNLPPAPLKPSQSSKSSQSDPISMASTMITIPGSTNYDFLVYNNIPMGFCEGKCSICDNSFGFFRGSVSCSFCGLIVCKKCSDSTSPAYPQIAPYVGPQDSDGKGKSDKNDKNGAKCGKEGQSQSLQLGSSGGVQTRCCDSCKQDYSDVIKAGSWFLWM